MARESGVKRVVNGKPKAAEPKFEGGGSGGEQLSDDVESHPLTKKVRWDNADVSEPTSREDAESDELLGPQRICLAIQCQHGHLGCAYYDPVKYLIYVIEDTIESPHFDLAQMVLDQANPDVVLTSSQADEKFMDLCRDQMDESGGIFQIRPYKDFSPAKGRDRLLSLRLLSELPTEPGDTDINSSSGLNTDSEPRNAYDFMRSRRKGDSDPELKRWNASIRSCNYASVEASPLCVASIGALIDYLTRERAVSDLDNEGIDGLEVRKIEALALDQVMHINADALFSLQVFDNESHASVHTDQTKEGLSLFGILDNTKTTLGRFLLRTWLQRPALSIPVITARHDAVDLFLRPENAVISDSLHRHLKGIKNIPRILGTLRCGKARLSDWQGVVAFAYHAAMLRDTLSEIFHAGGVEIVRKLITAFDMSSFREVGNAVNEIIDWEESANAGRVCVRPRIDEELDNRKHVYHGIDSVLSNVAEQITHTVPHHYAESLNVVYFPQLGFLICVPMLEDWTTEAGIEVPEGWTFTFSSESNVYFKSPKMTEMDIHIGDLLPLIVDREIEIVHELETQILIYDEAMGNACDVCAELDVLLSFAEASRAYEYNRPQMVEQSLCDIVDGRHPLQEQVSDTFVPNSCRLVGGAGTGSGFQHPEYDSGVHEGSAGDFGTLNSVVICTGANACGKSVYLKQIALIQLLSQIGCFVPAKSAILGIVDKIFTRIQTRESVSKVQSAFMIDLNQVSLALRNATCRSLVLLDEFGKGTVSTDGAGLFCGVIKHFLSMGSNCPKVLAATHFHEVFRIENVFNGEFDGKSIPKATFVHMQAIFTNAEGEILAPQASSAGDEHDSGDGECILVRPGDQITYLYKVIPGRCLESHAAYCATLFGLPQHVVSRARYVTHLLSSHELGRLLDEGLSEVERVELSEAEAVCRRFLGCNLNGVRDQLEASGEGDGHEVKRLLKEILGRNVTDIMKPC